MEREVQRGEVGGSGGRVFIVRPIASLTPKTREGVGRLAGLVHPLRTNSLDGRMCVCVCVYDTYIRPGGKKASSVGEAQQKWLVRPPSHRVGLKRRLGHIYGSLPRAGVRESETPTRVSTSQSVRVSCVRYFAEGI